MSTKKKLLQAAAGSASGGAASLNVEQLFSTYAYEGNGTQQGIDNGILLTDSYQFDYSFDGTQTAPTATISPNIGVTGTFEIEFWMRLKAPVSGNQWVIGTSQGFSSTGGFLVGVYNVSGYPTIAIAGDGFGGYGYSADTELFPGKTYHIVVNYNGSTLRVFIDGVLQGVGTGSTSFAGETPIFNTVDLGISSSTGSNYGAPFTGDLYGVSIGTSVTRTSTFTAPTMESDGATLLEEAAGGMVWIKNRDSAYTHHIYDTERGVKQAMQTPSTSAQGSRAGGLVSFNHNGFTLGNYTHENSSAGDKTVSWTFRKAPKFFDIQTWTGNGTNNRTVSHNLGSTPGMIIVKRTDSAASWAVWHRSGDFNPSEFKHGILNGTADFNNYGYFPLNPDQSSLVTDSIFTLTGDAVVNGSGGTYIAYIFAHNDGDGNFGPTGDQDIIKCGRYTESSNGTESVEDLGFEPQFVLLKAASSSGNWELHDVVRGMPVPWGVNQANSGNGEKLFPNTTGAKSTQSSFIYPTPNGFVRPDGYYGAGTEMIYMAIRRGDMGVPTDATDVFDLTTYTGNSLNNRKITTGFAVDSNLTFGRSGQQASWATRMTDGMHVGNAQYQGYETLYDWIDWGHSDKYEMTNGGYSLNNNNGISYVSYSWKRASKFFDVVCYTGNGTAGRTVTHNLNTVPEMLLVKKRNTDDDWAVYHSALGNTDNLFLNDAQGTGTRLYWNNTTPTDTSFTLGSHGKVNNAGSEYFAYLFASVDGVSKVGSYTGTGSDINIDCGFSNGARFVLIKRTDANGDWWVVDTKRGLVTGNDAILALNVASSEITSTDQIDPYSAGFTVAATASSDFNANGGNYIFYAIA